MLSLVVAKQHQMERLEEMVLIPSGRYMRGAGAYYPEEGPRVMCSVAPFAIDRSPVTNSRFSRFVSDTGYVTTAERPVLTQEGETRAEILAEPGSLVFSATPGPVPLHDWRRWWQWVPGATWRQPAGPGSDINGKADHPVTQVSFSDALAFAQWAGKRLPTEDEWEYAARGGLDGTTYSWGEALNAGGAYANTWQGRFPYENRGAGTDKWVGTSPVGAFPSNGFGLNDMIGNVWEWTGSPWSPRAGGAVSSGAVNCCSASARAPGAVTDRSRVLKGGSHLCAPEYCFRYRPAARSEQTEDSAASHIGFRCAANV